MPNNLLPKPWKQIKAIKTPPFDSKHRARYSKKYSNKKSNQRYFSKINYI